MRTTLQTVFALSRRPGPRQAQQPSPDAKREVASVPAPATPHQACPPLQRQPEPQNLANPQTIPTYPPLKPNPSSIDSSKPRRRIITASPRKPPGIPNLRSSSARKICMQSVVIQV